MQTVLCGSGLGARSCRVFFGGNCRGHLAQDGSARAWVRKRYGAQLSAQFFTHVTIVLPDLCVRCAGPSRELRGRLALAHFQQGVLTTEVSHKQVLMTLDKASFSYYGAEINLPIDWHRSQHPSSIDLSQPVDGQPDREFYCRCNLDAAL